MRVLVCVKRVPAPGARIVLTEDRQDIDAAHLGFTMSPHEECAVEAAVQLIEEHGGTATVLTLGPAEAEEQLRYAASIGATDGVLLKTDGTDWDPMSTANAIAESIAGLETEGGVFDLILFGNESADSGGYQVGIRVAHALGRPIASGIKHIDLGASPDGERSLQAHRPTDTGNEVYTIPMPAVLAVREGLNLPRYPTLKGRLGAKKAPVAATEPEPVGSGQRKISLQSPPQVVKETVVLGTGSAAAAGVVDVLEELGVL